MATKRSDLPSITANDIEKHPERLRKTPNGGWAWKCHYCGEFASSQTQKGLYVCRRHGGTTPKQRSPDERQRPPGRPMSSGKYSRSKMLSVHEVVQEYRQKLIDVDATDEDMLYLRAYLERYTRERPEEEDIATALEELLEQSEPLKQALTAEEPASHDALLRALAEIRLFRKALKQTSKVYARFMELTEENEARHERFIKLARLRFDINLKNAAAEQLQVFTQTLQRTLNILALRLPQDKIDLLRLRLEREFRELPERALSLSALKTITYEDEDTAFYRSHTLEDRIEELVSFLRLQNTEPDDTHEDMLYLRAYLRSLMGLADLVARTSDALQEVLEAVGTFTEADTGEGCSVLQLLRSRKEAEKVQRLEVELSHFVKKLKAFDIGLEKRHERIILLARVRLDSRLKETATEKITLFQLLLDRLQNLLLDVITPEDYEYMQQQLLNDSADKT